MVSSNSICDKDNTITSQTQLSLMNLEREADTKGQLLTLLWYPQGLTVGHHHLMQHTSELVEHSEALLLPNTRVVEAWQPGLQQTEGQPSRPALLPAANTWAQHGGGDTLWSWTKEGEFRLASSGSARLALKPLSHVQVSPHPLSGMCRQMTCKCQEERHCCWVASGSSGDTFQVDFRVHCRPDCPGHMELEPSLPSVVDPVCTLEASVRMSFESFTRHCSGTVTSITFTFSFLLLLSLTNFPYQAFTMMSPADRAARADTARPATSLWRLETQHPAQPRGVRILTHSGLLCFDYSSDRFLHQPNLGEKTDMSGTLDLFWSENDKHPVCVHVKMPALGLQGKEHTP